MPQPREEAREFFYLEGGEKRDAELHDFILDQGDDEAARAVSAKVAGRIISPKRLARLNGETAKSLRGFDPSEPRDEQGRWTSGGGSEDEGTGKPPPKTGPWSAGLKASGLAAADAIKAEWAKESPAKSIDDLMEIGPKDQAELASAAQDVEKETGVPFINPGAKGRKRTQEKLDEGRTPQQITDVVRGGFKVEDPAQADKIVAGLSKKFPVADEGWQRTPAGYFDRKLMVHFKDGMTGEVQLWHPAMFDAKETKGHPIYVLWRKTPPGTPQAKAYESQMQQIYGAVAAQLPHEWDQISGRAGR